MAKEEQIGAIDQLVGLFQGGHVSRRVFIGRLALLGVSVSTIGMLLDACSGPATSPTTSGQPKRGGTMIIGRLSEISALDPHTDPSVTGAYFRELVYNSLLKFDADLRPVGDLVQDGWVVSSDGLMYTFVLKPNLKFHNGDPVTSDDVKFTYDRIRDPKIPAVGKGFISSIASVEAPKPDTVVLHLSAPSAALPTYLAGKDTLIISKKVAQSGDLSKIESAIGTGPFKVDKWVPDSYMTLSRNPNFHEQGKPYLDGIRVNIIPSDDNLLAAFRAGSMDFVATGNAITAKKADGESVIKVLRTLGLPYNLFQIQTAAPPFSNPMVRQALSLALDRTAMIQGVSLGEGVVSGPIPPANKLWARPVSDWADYTPNPTKAKQLLAAAGYPSGFEFTMLTQTSDPDYAPKMAQIAQAQWAPIGVKVNIQQMEFAAWVQYWEKATFTVIPSNNSGQPDPDYYLYRWWHSTGNLQFVSGKWHSAELDTVLDRGRQSSDFATRKAAYDRAQEIIIQNNPMLPLYSGYLYTLLSQRTQGYQALPNDILQNIRNVWLST